MIMSTSSPSIDTRNKSPLILTILILLLVSGTPLLAATVASMQSPPPGSTLTGTTVTFAWSAGTRIADYRLAVGSSYDGSDIYSADLGTNTSVAVGNIPQDGRALYVKLVSVTSRGNSLVQRYTYTAPSSAPAPSSVATIWPPTAIPATMDEGADSPVELGVQFKSDVSGVITGIRFYKAGNNTGSHVGNLWSSTGTLLASATFTSETVSGWQQVKFAAPVAIAANTVYVASYHTRYGHYSDDQNYFANAGVDNPPLHAVRAGTSGSNGVYAYGSTSRFPTQNWRASNYWVDVVFMPASTAVTPAVGISVTPSTASLAANASGSFTATVTNASNTAVTWAVTGGTIAVSGNSVTYTAPANSGTYTVTATSVADATKKASATVTVAAAPVVGVVVSPSTVSLTCSKQTNFNASVSNTTNTAVTWTASGGTILSGSGNAITYSAPASPGTYTVTATSVADPNKKASATVIAAAAPAVAVSISPATASLAVNASGSFTATVTNTSNTAVTWTASGGTIAGSGNTVTYTAPANSGTYTVSATSVADSTKKASATVIAAAAPAVAVSISPATASLAVNASGSFTATVTNTSNTAVTWTVTGGTIAVSGNSVTYTAPANSGTYTVSATSVADPTKIASATVNVTAAPAVTVSVTPTQATVPASGSASFTASVKNAATTSVHWKVSAGAISGSGNTVTYVAPSTAGTQSVTATADADTTKEATATVTVATAAPVAVSISPGAASLPTGGTASFTAGVSNTTNTAVTWTATGGTISGAGNTITYAAPANAGTYVVKATSAADSTKSASATVSVSVPAPSPTPGGFEGFGAGATGGSNIVTISQASQFASAAGTAGNIVRFSFSGTISGNFTLANNVTIDGFSAPSPGITFTGSGDVIIPGNNNIIQGIRVKNSGNDCIHIVGKHDIIVDHVSTNACGDGNIDITVGSYNVTVSWSILANNASSGASLVKYGGAHGVTYHHNLWYSNASSGNTRVPWIEGEDCCLTGLIDHGISADIQWNVYDEWRYGMVFFSDGGTKVYGNMVGNLALNDDGGHAKNAIVVQGPDDAHALAYLAGNATLNSVVGLCPSSVDPAASWNPHCMTKANKINCAACQPSTPYATPTVTGPGPYDNAARIAEWQAVHDHAGVVTHFPDDSDDAGTRAGMTIPNVSLLSQAWNTQ
jgi:hypothetical protein